MELYEITIKRFPDGVIRYSANYISNYYSRGAYTDELLNRDNDPLRSIKNSYKRTVAQVSDLVHSNTWDYFFTLTFDGSNVDRYDYNSCCERVHLFTDRLYRSGALYIIVPEQHKDGAWHFHGLFSGLPDNQLYRNDNGYLSLVRFNDGFTSIDHVRDTHRASTYILKYMVKEFHKGHIPAGRQRYFASKRLNKPIIEYDIIDVSELDFLMSKAYYKKEVQSDFYSGWIFEVIDHGKGKETSEDT